MTRLTALSMSAVLSGAIGMLTFLPAVADTSADTAPAPEKYILKKEPKGAATVIATREKAKDKDDVVVVGRVGGRKNPWVKGAAAFSIVDTSLKACSELPGDTCPTPCDFCCEGNLAKGTLFVTVVDDATGRTLKQDARDALKLRELQTVVVQGKAHRDKNGNVSIAASKIFVRPDKAAAK